MCLTSALRISVVSLAIVTLAACGGSSSPSYGGAPGCSASTAIATSQVVIQNMSFSPACIKVAAGTTVTFTNNDSITHTVTADDGTYNSGNLSPAQAFLHAFATAGTSHYHCTIHAGMMGTVIVQ
jgi:plastocyanin